LDPKKETLKKNFTMRISTKSFDSSTAKWMSLFVLFISCRSLVVCGFHGRLPTTSTILGKGVALLSASHLLANKQETAAAGSFNNPISSLIGSMASSLKGNSGLDVAKPKVADALSQLGSPSWDEVRAKLESMQTDDEKLFRQNMAKGYGLGSPLHKIRLYDESNTERDIRVVFYRDSASWCPYCQKVWILLEEKKIPYRVEKVNMRCYGDKPASFMRMQPSGNIPVATIDGKTYGQSNDIMYALEEAFPEHKSLRPVAEQGMREQELLRLERTIFSSWLTWLTGRGDPLRFRKMFSDTLQLVERALVLSSGPFFMGKDVTIVDLMFAPFLERMAASLLYYKGFQMRVPPGSPTEYPTLNRWFDAMEMLESYQLTKSDYYTHCWDLPPQLGGCIPEPDGERYRSAIDGKRALNGKQCSWESPLEEHNGGVEPDWAGDEHAARREAGERISANHEAIVRFAARGAGRPGMPPVSAPLADPNATPSEAVLEAVDALLRTVCLALLEGVEKHDGKLNELVETIVSAGGTEFASGVVNSLSYMRDRVGVPRDMKLPAARQLRAHLNWVLGKFLEAKA
jgi:glutathione S-transferase